MLLYMHWDLQSSLRMSGDFESQPKPTRVKAQHLNQNRLEKAGLCRIMCLWVLIEFYTQSEPPNHDLNSTQQLVAHKFTGRLDIKAAATPQF